MNRQDPARFGDLFCDGSLTLLELGESFESWNKWLQPWAFLANTDDYQGADLPALRKACSPKCRARGAETVL